MRTNKYDLNLNDLKSGKRIYTVSWIIDNPELGLFDTEFSKEFISIPLMEEYIGEILEKDDTVSDIRVN